MKAKNIYLSIILFIATVSVTAQNSFITKIDVDNEFIVGYNTVQSADGDFFTVGYRSNTDLTNIEAFMVKTSEFGEIIAAVQFSKTDTIVQHKDISVLPNGNLLVYSVADIDISQNQYGGNSIIISEYTTDLELVSSFEKIFPEENLDISKTQMTVDGSDIYCYGTLNEIGIDNLYGSFIYKLSIVVR